MSDHQPDIISCYHYADSRPSHTKAYLWPAVLRLIAKSIPSDNHAVFDLGCGNGAFAARLAEEGFDVVGVDPSLEGIEHALRAHPGLRLEIGSAYEDLRARYGTFPVVVSLEVVEHLYKPRQFAHCVRDLLEPGGRAIISTPYHGYLKNVALVVAGKWDTHHDPLWDHGHVKFWSQRTLSILLKEAGFRQVRFERVGRIPPLAKSMIAIATR